MDWYSTVKTPHIISSTILFGMGAGIAFFMLRSHFANNTDKTFYATRDTVLADYLFTAPAALVQPVTGFWLVWPGGYGWMDLRLNVTYVLYIVAGLCCLPVV